MTPRTALKSGFRIFVTISSFDISMLIINSDDWGRSVAETDTALSCYKAGRITSVSAMVFMSDSLRAADLAKDEGIDVGLHLNLTQKFDVKSKSTLLVDYHDRIVRYMTSNKYSLLLYNPFLHEQFRYVYEAQAEEFIRIYGKSPSHIDGHHHTHLCTNMLLGKVIPAGNKVRRNFSFWSGEKDLFNRTYRRFIDQYLARRYLVTDYFFSLSQSLQYGRIARISDLAGTATIEVMTHPSAENEYAYLMSDDYLEAFDKLHKAPYSAL
jgi:chitin disaccharide deacetylase